MSKSAIIFSLIFGLSGATGWAKKRDGESKGACAHIQCEKGSKECREEKKECMSGKFDERMSKAQVDGLPAEAKQKWIERLENKIQKKEMQQKNMASHISDLKSKLAKVKSVKTKAAK